MEPTQYITSNPVGSDSWIFLSDYANQFNKNLCYVVLM